MTVSHRPDRFGVLILPAAPHHAAARALVSGLAEGSALWALPWPCVYEFLRVVTHPRVFDPPTSLAVVLEDLDSLLAASSLRLLGEGPAHRGHLRRAVEDGHGVRTRNPFA